MDFGPLIDSPPVMGARIFENELIGLEDVLTSVTMAERVTYDAEKNTIFVDLEGLEVASLADVDRIRSELESRCRGIGRRVRMIANCDGFILNPRLNDAFLGMLTYLQTRYSSSVFRHASNAFMRLKLVNALSERSLAPNVGATQDEAQQGLGVQVAGATTWPVNRGPGAPRRTGPGPGAESAAASGPR